MDREILEMFESRHQNQSKDVTLRTIFENTTYYEDFIPLFFSSNGEADSIRKMYSTIRESMESETEKEIPCINIPECYGVYKEYIEGMQNFIHDLESFNVRNTYQLSDFTEKVNLAKENNINFIRDLYNGRIKDHTIKSIPLSEAMQNIEFLIDFIPQLKYLREDCKTFVEESRYKTYDEKDFLINESVQMLLESVDQYCYETMKNIIKTYYDINDALNSPKEPKEPEYKFF